MFGKVLLDIAALKAECSKKFQNREFKQYAVTLGGSAYGSQYNTCCAYMSAIGTDEYGDDYWNAINQDYVYYDQYIYEAMEEFMRQGKKCPSMSFTHDFGCTYANLMSLVGEAKSDSQESKRVKVVLGACRILNYSPVSFGIMLSETMMRLLKLKYIKERGVIEIRNLDTVYCERLTAVVIDGQWRRLLSSRWGYARGVEKLTDVLAQVLS